MERAKGLTEGERATNVKEIAKGTLPKIITHYIGCHVDIVKHFLANPSPRKTRLSNFGFIKTFVM